MLKIEAGRECRLTGVLVTIEYRTIEGAPAGKLYFRCEPISATLSVEACAGNWRRAQGGDENAIGSLRCRSCPTGALHAGETAANLWAGRGQMICSRCHRGAVRLIGGWLDVSCYNREREWIRGRNARGQAPSKMAPLSPREIRVWVGDKRQMVRREYTQSAAELIVATLRDSREAVTFAFSGAPVARVLAQIPLF